MKEDEKNEKKEDQGQGLEDDRLRNVADVASVSGLRLAAQGKLMERRTNKMTSYECMGERMDG